MIQVQPLLSIIYVIACHLTAEANKLLADLAPSHYDQCDCIQPISDHLSFSQEVTQYYCWLKCLQNEQCYYFSYCVGTPITIVL